MSLPGRFPVINGIGREEAQETQEMKNEPNSPRGPATPIPQDRMALQPDSIHAGGLKMGG
jgi:hypothetical protein